MVPIFIVEILLIVIAAACLGLTAMALKIVGDRTMKLQAEVRFLKKERYKLQEENKKLEQALSLPPSRREPRYYNDLSVAAVFGTLKDMPAGRESGDAITALDRAVNDFIEADRELINAFRKELKTGDE